MISSWVIIGLILVGVGGFVGFCVAILPFIQLIASHSKAETLGKLLTPEMKNNVSLVYHDPENAVNNLDEFSWAVRNVLTPFVGSGPMPGKNHNAYINSMQFRAEREVTIPKPQSRYRIFLTGGSTAYGAGAPSEDRTIGGYLNKILNTHLSSASNVTYEVFTIANPAWASTHERIIIENRLSELEGDMVISFSGTNEAHWGMTGRNILWFRSYADQLLWDLLNSAYQRAGSTPMPDVTAIESSPIGPAVVARRLEKNIRLSALALSLVGARYVFILQPTLPLTRKQLTDREEKIHIDKWSGKDDKYYFNQVYNQMREHLTRLNIGNLYFLDQSAIFDNYDDKDEMFLDSHHFGDRGNEIIAQNIVTGIRPIIESEVKTA